MSPDEQQLLFASTFRASDIGLSICIQFLTKNLQDNIFPVYIKHLGNTINDMVELIYDEKIRDEVNQIVMIKLNTHFGTYFYLLC